MELRRFAWLTLIWNVFVVLWGAVVRSTGSGAGCGRSWPTCQGTIVPELQGATAVEFGHRVVSGLALILVAVLVIRIFRSRPKGDPARRGAVLSSVAIVIESLIGAMIVFYEWVADDASVARVISVPLHLVNTFFLLAVLTLTVFWLGGHQRVVGKHPAKRPLYGIGAGMVLIAATGGVTALADTLFPKDGFTVAGIFTFSASEHFLTDLRIIHPIVAILVGVIAAVWARRRGWSAPHGGALAARLVVAIVGVQILIGFLNVVLLTPTWMTLIHLLLADALWIAWVWLAAAVLQPESSEALMAPDSIPIR
jgi:heme A synthase